MQFIGRLTKPPVANIGDQSAFGFEETIQRGPRKLRRGEHALRREIRLPQIGFDIAVRAAARALPVKRASLPKAAAINNAQVRIARYASCPFILCRFWVRSARWPG